MSTINDVKKVITGMIINYCKNNWKGFSVTNEKYIIKTIKDEFGYLVNEILKDGIGLTENEILTILCENIYPKQSQEITIKKHLAPLAKIIFKTQQKKKEKLQ